MQVQSLWVTEKPRPARAHVQLFRIGAGVHRFWKARLCVPTWVKVLCRLQGYHFLGGPRERERESCGKPLEIVDHVMISSTTTRYREGRGQFREQEKSWNIRYRFGVAIWQLEYWMHVGTHRSIMFKFRYRDQILPHRNVAESFKKKKKEATSVWERSPHRVGV